MKEKKNYIWLIRKRSRFVYKRKRRTRAHSPIRQNLSLYNLKIVGHFVHLVNAWLVERCNDLLVTEAN